MKLKLFTTVFLLVIVFVSNAQHDFKKFSVGPGIVTAFAIGDLSKSAQIGYGASVQAVYRFGKSYEAFLEPTFAAFSSATAFGNSFNMLTAVGGVRYILPFKMTVGAGIGYGNLSPEFGDSFGGLAIAPNIGYQDGKRAFHLFYTNISSSGTNAATIGVRAYWMF
jgi:hypothetical protein